MEEIIFVTHNKGKAASAEKHFKNLKIKTFEYELDEPRSDDIKEIAKSKVMEAYSLVHKPCMALDAGFFIEQLNGFPKAFINFSLETIGIKGILKLMKDVENRKCEFRECLAYYDGKEVLYFYGESKGSLSEEELGLDSKEKWSDLWYIFKPMGFNKTLAQMTPIERKERRLVDKSTSALENFATWYQKEYKN